MNPKCNLPKEEREAVLSKANPYLSIENEEIARGLFPQYLFYMDDDQVVCTACRERFEVSPKKRGKHGSDGTCPQCGSKATWAAVGKYNYNMPSLESWIKTAVAYTDGNGGLYIDAGDMCRTFNQDNLFGEIEWIPRKIYYFRPGAVMMCTIRLVYNCWDFREYETMIVFEERVKEPFAPNMQGYCDYAGDYSIIGLEEALEASAFKYCQIFPFYEYEYGAKLRELDTARWMVKYLAWYALHPQIEMAVKFGLSDAVIELVEKGKPNKRLLNWDATTPAEFLRMSKEDARIFGKAQMSFRDLKAWKETAPKKSLKEYIDLADMVGGTENLKKISDCARVVGVELDKAARYIARLIPPCRQYVPPTSHIIQTWKDYLDMAKKLDYDLKEPTVIMPKDLEERHDAAAAIIRHNASEAERKKYKKRQKKLVQQYAFSLGELCIVVPKSSEEIIQEGKTLKHCVGGYAARHINGTTTILFLRKRRTPWRSFLTIELEETRGRIGIRQIHGYQNERYGHRKTGARPEERYADFLQTWLDWVNAGSERDKDGRPILPEEEVKSA